MNDKQIVTTSKFLSLVLRHDPSALGITLDSNGWADVEKLLELMNARKKPLTREQLEQVVAANNKKRFAFSEDGSRIRANQGHSIEIDLALSPLPPPETLYHGTATRFLDSIMEKGLLSGSRQHVHLSQDLATAMNVGMRHGKPVVLIVDCAGMSEAGHAFYRSENHVWLTESVPTTFLKVHQERHP